MILDIPLPRNNSKAGAGDVTDHQICLFLKIRTRIGCIIFFHDDIMKLHPAKSGADFIRFLTRKIIGVNTALRKERSCQHGLSSRSSTKVIHLHSSEKIPLPSCKSRRLRSQLTGFILYGPLPLRKAGKVRKSRNV